MFPMRDLSNLLTQIEGQYFERKSLWDGPPERRKTRDRRAVRDQIAEYVAAFANADGGTLVLGVEDDGILSGHGYTEEAVAVMLQVPVTRLTPSQSPGERVIEQGHELLLFEVPAAERAVMVHGDGFPRRVHDTVVMESEEVINAIKSRSRVESIEMEILPSVSIETLDIDLIRRAQEGAGLGHLEPADYLCERRLGDYRGHELVLRKGALLLFARQARDIDHPNVGVRIFRVNGTERLTGPRHNVQEILPRIEGALPQVIERAYHTLSGLIHRSSRLHHLFFREMPEYPTFAWQEGLVNAVAHRDYRSAGQSIEVWLYEDRLEIINPGDLPPEVDLERLKQRQPLHYSRNPRLTRVLAELALMREQGEGIPRIFEEMEQSWLRLPEFRTDAHRFTLILRNQPIFETPDTEWVRYVQSLPISQRQRRILAAYPQGSSFTSADYQTLNEVDRDAAYRELKDMVDLALVSAPVHKGRGARYHVLAPPVLKPTPQQGLAARMARQGFIQNKDYREIFGINRLEASQRLADLVIQGVLIRQGERRGARYQAGPVWENWLGGAQKPS